MPKDNDQYKIYYNKSDRTMKVLLIGNSGVGKSNILMRFAVHIYLNI
jgi:GTPase SAR1 family protein